MNANQPLKIYIGWDSREPIAADVCKFSIQAHSSIPVEIHYLQQKDLRKRKIYSRPEDTLGSTEFTFTRFLVPYLANYQGWAIFVDCDFLFLDDIGKILQQADPDKAVQVVQHDYQPTETTKMDGKEQHLYPRKNWSSFILFNCEHPENRQLSNEFVNSASGRLLHRFQWLEDNHIGKLSHEWNWLVGWYKEPRDGKPRALHYTLGGPWFDEWKDCEYADEWNYYRSLVEQKPIQPTVGIDQITLPDRLKERVTNYYRAMLDPWGILHDINKEVLAESILNPKMPEVIAMLDGGEEDDDAVSEERDSTIQEKTPVKDDKILENFIIGANGAVGRMNILDSTPTSVPIVLRGITKRKVMRRCEEEGRDYYYVDTGYFGNEKKKDYHRVTKNAMQYFKELDPDCPEDRFLLTRTKIQKQTPGNDILICPPSDKAMKFWGLTVDDWLDETVSTIKANSDRKIVIRKKGTRTERVQIDTMEMALSRDVHCMVTFNSIAAVESLIYGKPVFTMGPNAAQPLANNDLTYIDTPFMPDFDQVRNLMCNLAYQQFTVAEMRSGKAWAMLRGLE